MSVQLQYNINGNTPTTPKKERKENQSLHCNFRNYLTKPLLSA